MTFVKYHSSMFYCNNLLIIVLKTFDILHHNVQQKEHTFSMSNSPLAKEETFFCLLLHETKVWKHFESCCQEKFFPLN